MKEFNNLRRMLRAAAVVTAIAAMTFASCTKVDDTLGSNLIPDDQQMRAGYTTLGGRTLADELNPKRYVETRLYQTDSLIASNLSYGYMGSMLSDTFGLRSAGFLSQYLCYYKVDSGYFGFRPIFDSAQLLITVGTYGSDTLTPQLYNVYEVISNKYLTDKPISPGKSQRDTTFYLNFDPVKEGAIAADAKPLFTFTFPDGVKTGPATMAVTMSATPEGKEFVERLMLQRGDYKGNYSIYSTDSLEQWVQAFKGIYIAPASPQIVAEKGNIYSLSLESSGFQIFGRNRVPSDPTLIKDTVSATFYFYDTYSTKYGNVSVNTVTHDYSKANPQYGFDIADARETNPNRPLSKQVYVAGMGGVVTELSFSQDFFEALEQEIAAGNKDGKDFKTLALSQVIASFYMGGSNYDWFQLNDAMLMIDQMNASQSRLGLYTNYKRLSGITDYAYLYEQNYNTTLAYGGYINRSRGCYVMDITAYAQELWNSYLKAKREAGANASWNDFKDKIENRSIYLAPEAYSLYTPRYSVTQGMTPEESQLSKKDAPIKLDITYNLIK